MVELMEISNGSQQWNASFIRVARDWEVGTSQNSLICFIHSE